MQSCVMTKATEEAMALSTKEIVVWYYSSSEDPWATALVWTGYRDSEMYAVEDAFCRGGDNVRPDSYRIDLKSFIQLRLNDDT